MSDIECVQAHEAKKVLRVSRHFPQVPRPCKKVGEEFFNCLHKNGKQPEGVRDPDAGTKAMETCATQLKSYNECVDRELEKKPRKLFRVPKAYRVRDSNA
jgi:hypothetical protein